VIFLHGGLANTDYWGNQVPAVAAHHTVILMDSRGHGCSTRDAGPYGYDLMADDVVALRDVLKIPKADVVGWSDGGILGIDLAMRHEDRVGKVFRLRRQHSHLRRGRGRREKSDVRRLYRPCRPRIC
jgi:pimeloyl-ACP methyl ester carboxylesterase